MAGQPRTIKIFVSSPGDVQLERDALMQVVHELNETIAAVAPEKGITLELIRWETHVPPGIDARGPQGRVAKYIPEYDIFIGIMWKRFGTPTARFGSGTEDEFRDAYARWEKTREEPQIIFYFCRSGVGYPDDEEELNQLQKVVAFRKELNEKGLIESYSDRDSFAGLVRHHLNLVLAPMFSAKAEMSELAHRVGSVALANDDAVERSMRELADRYVSIRKAMEPSDERTRQMEVIISQMRTLAFTAYPLLPRLTQSVPENQGRDARAGERLAAVALLQAVPNADYVEWLADRLGQERPFLGYHAAVALLTAARTLRGDARPRLKAAVGRAIGEIRHVPADADRKRILQDALKELSDVAS